MDVRHALVKQRLPGLQVDGGLAVEHQAMRPSLDIDDARDMLLGNDVVADGLRKPDEPDVDGTGRKAVELSAVQGFDGGTVRRRLGVGRK